MSRFYVNVDPDNRNTVTRCGHNRIDIHTRGWNTGIRVSCFVNDRGNNEYRVYKTGGSNDPSSREMIYEYEEV